MTQSFSLESSLCKLSSRYLLLSQPYLVRKEAFHLPFEGMDVLQAHSLPQAFRFCSVSESQVYSYLEVRISKHLHRHYLLTLLSQLMQTLIMIGLLIPFGACFEMHGLIF